MKKSLTAKSLPKPDTPMNSNDPSFVTDDEPSGSIIGCNDYKVLKTRVLQGHGSTDGQIDRLGRQTDRKIDR